MMHLRFSGCVVLVVERRMKRQGQYFILAAVIEEEPQERLA